MQDDVTSRTPLDLAAGKVAGAVHAEQGLRVGRGQPLLLGQLLPVGHGATIPRRDAVAEMVVLGRRIGLGEILAADTGAYRPAASVHGGSELDEGGEEQAAEGRRAVLQRSLEVAVIRIVGLAGDGAVDHRLDDSFEVCRGIGVLYGVGLRSALRVGCRAVGVVLKGVLLRAPLARREDALDIEARHIYDGIAIRLVRDGQGGLVVVAVLDEEVIGEDRDGACLVRRVDGDASEGHIVDDGGQPDGICRLLNVSRRFLGDRAVRIVCN